MEHDFVDKLLRKSSSIEGYTDIKMILKKSLRKQKCMKNENNEVQQQQLNKTEGQLKLSGRQLNEGQKQCSTTRRDKSNIKKYKVEDRSLDEFLESNMNQLLMSDKLFLAKSPSSNYTDNPINRNSSQSFFRSTSNKLKQSPINIIQQQQRSTSIPSTQSIQNNKPNVSKFNKETSFVQQNYIEKQKNSHNILLHDQFQSLDHQTTSTIDNVITTSIVNPIILEKQTNIQTTLPNVSNVMNQNNITNATPNQTNSVMNSAATTVTSNFLTTPISINSTTAHSVFKPVRSIFSLSTKNNHYKNFMDLFSNTAQKIDQQDKNILSQSNENKIKIQLEHNSIQMSLIKEQNDSQRMQSFQNILNMKHNSDYLIKNSGKAKKVQLINFSQIKDNINLNNFQSNTNHPIHNHIHHNNFFNNKQIHKNQIQNNHIDSVQNNNSSIPPLNQNSKTEIDNESNQQKQKDQLQFHWERIDNYSSQFKPEFREGATMVQYKSNFYLYGGFGHEIMNSVYQFRLRDYQWNKIEGRGEIMPNEGRFGHSANVYKNKMIVFGGGGGYNHKMKCRLVLNELWTLNLDSLEWKQMRTTGEYIESRRNHAACVVGNYYYIYGGVQTNEKYLSGIHVLNIEKCRWRSWNFKQDELGVAFHQMVPIFARYLSEIPSKQFKSIADFRNKMNKLKIKEEGIYTFGGKQGNEKIRGKLMILKCDQKDSPLEWIIPETLGQNPPSRFHHSMIFNWHLKGLVVYGGRNDEQNIIENVFQDIWLLYLTNLMWVQVKVSGTQNRYRFSHAFANIDERLFIFGGASNLSYTDCDLYVLEMNSEYAQKKKYTYERDMVNSDLTVEKVQQNEEIEGQKLQKMKTIQQRGSCIRTFLRPPTRLQLKLQQEEENEIDFEQQHQYHLKQSFNQIQKNKFKSQLSHSYENSSQCSASSPRIKNISIFKDKQIHQFSEHQYSLNNYQQNN